MGARAVVLAGVVWHNRQHRAGLSTLVGLASPPIGLALQLQLPVLVIQLIIVAGILLPSGKTNRYLVHLLPHVRHQIGDATVQTARFAHGAKPRPKLKSLLYLGEGPATSTVKGTKEQNNKETPRNKTVKSASAPAKRTIGGAECFYIIVIIIARWRHCHHYWFSLMARTDAS